MRVLGRLLMGAPPAPGVGWEAVSGLARQYGLSPLLYYRLLNQQTIEPGQEQGTCVPADIVECLRHDFHAIVAHAMAAEQQLAGILEAFAAASVPAVIVKGPAVAAFYPHPALRTYGDLDLLVPPENLDRAERALEELGYRCSGTGQGLVELGFRHLPPVTGDDNWIAVEIHWRLDDDERVGRLPLDELWARAVPWSVKGQPALRLEAVDAALHLSRHAMVQHLGRWSLLTACDLAFLTRDWKRDRWQALAKRAVDWELGRAVYLMLRVMQQVFGIRVPRGTMHELCRDCDDGLPSDLVERLVVRGAQPEVQMSGSAVQAWANRTLAAKAEYFLRHLFLPRAAMAVVYHLPADSFRVWLAYLWRPIDLLLRFGPAALGALRRHPAERAAWRREVWLQRWLRGEVE